MFISMIWIWNQRFTPFTAKYNNSTTAATLTGINPLTPVPPVTARDEPWPFFLFWCHRFWPKLASSILNFCRRKRSFQWCPDQSDRPNGALDMHKNAQKVEWKTWSKIPKIKKPKDVGHLLAQKFWFLRTPESQCTKTRCWRQERPAVVLPTYFPPDQR